VSITRAFLIGLLLVPAGHFAFAQDEAPEGEDSEERICLNVRAIRSFDALTDEYVFVQEGNSKYYLFTMRNRCHNLSDAMGIAIKDSMNRVCSNGFGEIVYRDRMGGGRRLESCRIDTIERVESKDDAKAIVAARTEAKSNDE
jgi:hypothetical protein